MSPPEWHPHEHPEYDELLLSRSAAELARLVATGGEGAEAFLRNTREVHARLYEGLTPPGHPEYAGTYRGTVGTALENRRAGANLVTRDGHFFFIEPDKVESYLKLAFGRYVDNIVSAPATASPEELFLLAVKIFQLFGMIHPYLDGNGHIQRLIFAAAVAYHEELELQESWTIHPRPYDIEMAAAFEQGSDALSAITALLSPHVKR